MRRIQILSFTALIAMGVLAGCASSGPGGVGSVSLDQEWQLGQQMAAQVAQQYRFVNDPAMHSYIQAMGDRIVAQTPLAGRPFEFEIIDDPSVNAFSIPGGHVYINSGLIGQANQADMLAGVMAHEISHVVARHVLKQIEQQNEINTVGSILLGQNPNALTQIVAQIVAGGAMARFSRADEKEADDLGLQYMAAAGYNPHGMLDMFQKLLAEENGGNSAVSRFFADHPGTQDRINDISGRIQRMAANGLVDDPTYDAMQRRYPSAMMSSSGH
jgi:predicted Zn-dependent protease